MEISRNVILDLLPLYFANELSEDSRALVEKHLEDDPQLAKLARQSETMALSEKIPVALTQNDELIAYRKARQVIIWRTIVIAAAIAVFLVLVLAMFFTSSSASDTSCTVAERVAPLRTPPGPAMETLEGRCENSWGLLGTADSDAEEHEPSADNDCILILQQEPGYTADNRMTKKTLSEGMKSV